MTAKTRLALLVALALAPATAVAQKPDLYDLGKVRDVKLYFKQSNWWQQLLNNYSSKTEIKADMKIEGRTLTDVGVRFRGNTSYRRLPPSSQKRGFNIRTDSFVAGQDIWGYDHLNLNNGYHDPTFTREVVMYQICRRYMSAPKANFVRVWLNDQFWGIYINVQQPNKDMFSEWFEDGGGNRYRGFGFPFDNSALNWLGPNPASYRNNYEFKKGDGTDLVNMIRVLTQTPISQLETALPAVWSVDQGYWYCIAMNAMVHTDSYIGTGKDHFEYHDPVHGRFHILPFDVNESLGGQASGGATLSPWYNTNNSRRPILNRTLQIPRWRARYIAHFRTVLEESISWQEIGGLVTKYQAMIARDVQNDAKKIYTTAQFTQNVTQDIRVGRSTIRGLKPLFEARERYLRGLSEFRTQRATISALANTPVAPRATDRVAITARISGATRATLYHRTRGEYLESPMLDDGKNGDGAANDGVYGAWIAPQAAGTRVDYFVSASTGAGVMRFVPKYAEGKPASYRIEHPRGNSPITLNELLAKNETGIKDNAGEREDWLELYNGSNQAVQVGGMYLTDRYDTPTKWQIPGNQSIPAGGTLLVWCDEDATQGPLHASFKLSASGEEALLFASDGKTLLDIVTFGRQTTDISTGRMFDGGAPRVTFMVPTPGAKNAPGTGGTRAYSALDSAAHVITASLSAAPKIGTSPSLQLAGGVANSAFLVPIAATPVHIPFGDVALLAFPPAVIAVIPSNATGAGATPLPIPNIPALAGTAIYVQALGVSGSEFLASNGLEITFVK